MVRFNEAMVAEFYREHVSKPYFPQILEMMTADVVVGIEAVGGNVLQVC